MAAKSYKWYEHERLEPETGDNDEEILLSEIGTIRSKNLSQHFKDLKIQFTFQMCRNKVSAGGWLSTASHAMALKAVKNKHKDIDIFLNPYPVIYNKKDKCWVPFMRYWDSWVMDMDNTPFSTISELLEWIGSTGVPLPIAVSQTGKRNFHVQYVGNPGYWTAERRTHLKCQLAGLKEIPTDNRILSQLLQKYAYIDPSFDKQNPLFQKIRLPGSVKLKGNERFIVLGWYSDNYNINDPYKPFKVDELEQPVVKLIPVVESETDTGMYNKSISDKVHDKFYPIVEREVLAVLGNSPTAKGFAEVITRGLGHAKNKELFLKQTYLAEELGVNQCTISKKITMLKKAGIITETKVHVFKSIGHEENRVKEYGIGPKLKYAMGYKQRESVPASKTSTSRLLEVLKRDYEENERHSGMLDDIRASYVLGVKKEDFIELALSKLRDTPFDYWKTEGRIAASWDNWEDKVSDCEYFRKKGYYRPAKPLINVHNIIRDFNFGVSTHD